MRGQHLIKALPQNMDEFERLLYNLGYCGWELIYIKGAHAYFMQHGVPLLYKVIKNSEYVDNYTTDINNFGLVDWIFIQTRNGYSFFKQIAIA